MSRFFVRADQIEGDTITLFGSDANHIARVLRYAVGDPITICDMQRNVYDCVVCRIAPETVQATIQAVSQSQTESAFSAVLYQALPKGDKMETVIQKAVECGVFEIYPVVCERCVVKLDAQQAQKKVARWQKIAQSAAEQSGRGIIPTVHLPISYAKAIEQAKESDCAFLCYEGEQSRMLGQILPIAPKTISFFIGPEGGFCEAEVERAKQAGMESVGLGKRILRTETASTFVLSCLVFHYELQG